MRRLLVMSKLLNTLISVALCSSAASAGPSTPAMAAGSSESVSRAEPSSAAAVTTDVSFDRLTDQRPMVLADVTDLAPADSHPMIPLPPAVWAAFVGLAYVARRVTRRHAI
jgi:hypothetical protein